jgi:hypothetical protein
LETKKIEKIMNDVIGHLVGTCGESHPHLLNLSAIGVGIVGYISYIKFAIKTKIEKWKRK